MSRGGLAGRWRAYRRQGWSELFYRGLRRALAAAGGVADVQCHIVIVVAPENLCLPHRMPKGLTVRELTTADVAAVMALRPAVGRAYGARFARHHRALGAFLQQQLVAFVWLRWGAALLPTSFGAQWQLEPGMTWVYDLYSDPQVLGAITHIYAYLRAHAPSQGCRLLVGQTDLDNYRSRHTHASLGYGACATVWSVRLWRGWVHVHHARTTGWGLQWGWARLPLHRFTQGQAAAGGATGARAGTSAGLEMLCACGRVLRVGAAGAAAPGTAFCCDAGHTVAQQEDGWLAVGAAIPYWGELPQPSMANVLQAARREGWRTAVQTHLSPELARYIGGRERADFEAVLPLTPGARVLDVGAGWGGVAAVLARRYEVTALEGVRERAEFIALRRRQDGLERLSVVQGNIHTVPLLPGQFDLIVANGMLEWSALLDTGAPVRAVQLRFLSRLHDLLTPGGMIYLAIENRFGLAAWRGARDHSGLRYTSLVPRPVARWICRRHSQYRAQVNRGYRTYTYSLRGYRRLFRDAGLEAETTWFCPWGYNLPVKLVPLETAALAFCFAAGPVATARAPGWRVRVRRTALHGPAMRWLASDFAFLLRAREAGSALRPRPAGDEVMRSCTSSS